MSSPLENIPCDVLQYIALLASLSSPLDPPVEILRLMQTGPAIYEALNIRNAPHIYARLFASKFDIAAPFRRYRSTITDSALTAGLVDRCRLLQRSKRGDVSARNLLRDLSTALWMYLESDGVNERQLLNVSFPEFILSVARTHLKWTSSSRGTHQNTSIGKIIIWLLCLALSRQSIFDIPELGRQELFAIIFPYLLPSEEYSPLGPCPNCSPTDKCRCVDFISPYRSPSPALDGRLRAPTGGSNAVFIPDPSLAAGNLASVFLESAPIKMPPHLRETRGIPLQVVEPTKSDFKAFADYETPLFADSLILGDSEIFNVSGTPRSTLHDLEFRGLMMRTPLDLSYPKIRYRLGSMTAVWEGVFRTIDAPAGSSEAAGLSSVSNFARPIQCALNEYVNDDQTCRINHIQMLSLSDIFLNQDGSELYAKECVYRRYEALKNFGMSELPGHDAIHDVILHGETLENHDHAWGGFKFWGLVDEDGKVSLKRSAKEGDISQGVWEFDGRLRFGSVLIGRWRMTGGSDNIYHGIFSMTRM